MKKVLCSGTFDILHKGHEEFLKDAKRQGNYLIVNVIPDKHVINNKGRPPINTQKKRVEALKRLKIADRINPVTDNFDETLKLIVSIRPDVFVFGYDQDEKFIDKIKEYLSNKGISTEYYVSKEFAGGIHTHNIK